MGTERRYAQAPAYTDRYGWTVRPMVDVNTLEVVSQFASIEIDHEVQDQIDQLFADARLRRDARFGNRMIRKIKELFNIF
jgi:hypothetical protein